MTYDQAWLKNVFFKADHHITFTFDLSAHPVVVRILSGDVTTLGLNNQTTFLINDIIEAIEPDNALAEIEGKMTFIADTLRKIERIKNEDHFYLPLKHQDNTLWCSIGLEMVETTASKRVVLGRVNRVSHSIPKAIIYYQKAFQDPLTKLFTRETLRLHLSNIKTFDGCYGLFIDIDNFKKVNDIYGHHRGDALLQTMAKQFIDNWEHDVIYYRLGGDEFFVYVSKHSEAEVIERAKALIRTIEAIQCHGQTYPISASIGIVPINEATIDYLTLLDLSDQTMYQSKAKGHGHYTLYQHDDTNPLLEKKQKRSTTKA